MAQSGDDCYFFYYSKCSKGASCPFRHQEAALGTETVCPLWKEGRCFRPVCPYRHMDIQKNRSHIPCYWEKQPGGCQKRHCAFLHAAVAPRAPQVDTSKESVLPTPDPLDWNTLKMMHPPPVTGPAQRLCQELVAGLKDVPSPKVEQLVINPFEEESDQESMNGTPQKVTKSETDMLNENAIRKTKVASKVISLKRGTTDDEASEIPGVVSVTSCAMGDLRITKTEGDTSLGIKTLEEIQREKALQSLLRNKSITKVIEQPLASGPLLIEGSTAPLTRRVVISSDVESSINIPSKKPIKRNFLQREIKADVILDASEPGAATSPKEKDESSRRSVKERLGLKAENVGSSKKELNAKTNQRLPDENSAYIRSSAGVKSISSTSDSDSDSSVRRKVDRTGTSRVTLTKVISNEDNALHRPPSKVCKVEKPTVVIKSLDEIKREKSQRRKEADRSNNDSTKCDRKTRPSMEIYQPPVRLRTGASVVSQPNKKDVEDKPVVTERQKPDVQNETAAKKTDAWLHVKSFAEIMKEKQEKKQKDQAVDDKASENSDKADKGKLFGERKRTAEDKRNKIPNISTKDEEDVTEEADKRNGKQMDATETSKEKSTNGLPQQPKRKFVPVVFDLESKPRAPKRSLSPVTVDNKSKQVSEPVLKSIKLSNSLASEAEQKEPPRKSLTIPVAEKMNSSTSNTDSFSGKSRRLSQRVSSSGSIQSELKAKNPGKSSADNGTSTARDKAAAEVPLEEEEDDFTRQLDDLIVNINCNPNEDFPGLTDESQNDDDLLLEMQELLS